MVARASEMPVRELGPVVLRAQPDSPLGPSEWAVSWGRMLGRLGLALGLKWVPLNYCVCVCVCVCVWAGGYREEREIVLPKPQEWAAHCLMGTAGIHSHF